MVDYEIEKTEGEIFIYCLNVNDYFSVLNDRIKINQKIFDKEDFDYTVREREDMIDLLIDWIAEAKGLDKEMMKSDLKYLINAEDTFIFSSILTNEYILKSKNPKEFNKLCEKLLKLNKKYGVDEE